MFQIIPAIDIIEGRCVRLTQGDYAQKKIYNENPIEVAKEFEDAGIQRLHLVDLDGAKAKRIINWKVLEGIASQTKLWIDFGGGVQSDEDLAMAFGSGAKQITGGSIALKKPEVFEKWLSQYGGERIILGSDARNEQIAVSGWEENSQVSVYDFVEDYVQKGVQYTISTDVAKDGLLQGPSFELYTKLQERCPNLHIIASGGVSQMADIEQLADMSLFGVIVGKAIYEGRISVKQVKEFMSK
jgi:phosphoribosylformimino-5-aminoimidazole carboxamide ribotide isomerase